MPENIDIAVNKLIALLKGNFERLSAILDGTRVGIVVSGGLDSSIIAHFARLSFKDPIFLSLAGKESQDKPYLDILENYLETNIEILDSANFNEQDIKNTKDILIKAGVEENLMQLSLGLGFYLLGQRAQTLKVTHILTGQGSDEIFGGYTRYKHYAGDLKNYLKNDYEIVGGADYKRDNAIFNSFNMQIINPYEEKDFLNYALDISPSLKLYSQNGKIIEKYILRLVAQKLKLPSEIVWRPKKAFQYSSRIQKNLAAYLGIKI